MSIQYRALRQTDRIRFSSLTGWEAPDPAWWTEHGYAVVSCDVRGAGTSEGRVRFFSDQEGEDVYDLIEWAARQEWSTGTVGLLGVSYLAISQWKAAALGPPSLKAICPWEGFTDAYRDMLRPAVSVRTGSSSCGTEGYAACGRARTSSRSSSGTRCATSGGALWCRPWNRSLCRR